MGVSVRLRGALAAASHARELRGRRPPQLTVGRDQSGPPRVFYLTPEQSAPRGGVRMLYRHVDLLTDAGIDAAVLHAHSGFRCEWFANSTRTAGADSLVLRPSDILVVPEFYAVGLDLLPVEPRKIVFNQGAYHTFDHIPFDTTEPGQPYSSVTNLIAMLTVSNDSAALLRHTFPTIQVHRARAVLDGGVFHPGPLPGDRQLAFIPRRRPQERGQLLHVLRSRGALDGWRLVPIEGYTEAETAQLMRSSAIFLSFSDREGFGLPPAEAMASGCYVIGYTGNGGRDYFDARYSAPIAESDLLAYAVAVEDAIARYEKDPESLARDGRDASAAVLGRYHESGLRQDLVDLYEPLVS
jgi:glycosyltransferase involved in cell wall biosynthesis